MNRAARDHGDEVAKSIPSRRIGDAEDMAGTAIFSPAAPVTISLATQSCATVVSSTPRSARRSTPSSFSPPLEGRGWNLPRDPGSSPPPRPPGDAAPAPWYAPRRAMTSAARASSSRSRRCHQRPVTPPPAGYAPHIADADFRQRRGLRRDRAIGGAYLDREWRVVGGQARCGGGLAGNRGDGAPLSTSIRRSI